MRSDASAPITPDFDALYEADGDPWSVATSWYERRKLAVMLASLPKEHYEFAWEPGCGPGLVSPALAARATRLLATDTSEVAVGLARRRLNELSNVEIRTAALPGSPLPERADLIVVAEFLYYVDDLATSLDVIWSSLRPGGNLVIMHWRHHPHDAYRSGRAMHAAIAMDALDRDAALIVTHADQDFLLDVYEASS